jgi:hypothetical protein
MVCVSAGHPLTKINALGGGPLTISLQKRRARRLQHLWETSSFAHLDGRVGGLQVHLA